MPARRRTVAAVVSCVGLAVAVSCTPGDSGVSEGGSAAAPGDRATGPIFEDRAQSVGLDFVHVNGMTGQFFINEIIGSGAALFDYDNDGDLDVYMVQGGSPRLDGGAGNDLPSDRLYRNDLVESGELRFVDVTASSGIEPTGYGMGVAAADYDRDGWVDLYVTNYGPNALFRNNGDGTFADVTETSGTGDDRWSTSAAFVDYDADGLLDLFVANYVDFSPATHQPCFAPSSAQDYCGPLSFKPYPDRLYRNRGDGTFEDATAAAQIGRAYGAGLGVVCSDLNGDGLVDIYVANDAHANQLWVNRGDGTFENEALLAGCAFNVDGKAEASMGVDAADFDGDGDDDLFMTHLNDETNTLYVNDGSGSFDDGSLATGIGAPSRNFTGFGTAWVDYDNDGLLDLLIVNGAVKTLPELARSGDPFPLHQTNQLFRNLGQGRFRETGDEAGPAFATSEVSRGAAFGDVDNDGDADVLISNNNGRARLLINRVGQDRGWIAFRVTDPDGRFDVLGTRVELVREDGTSTWRAVRAAASYCSSNDPRVLFGLGEETAVRAVRAHWPDGGVEEWAAPVPGRYTTLRRGAGDSGATGATGTP